MFLSSLGFVEVFFGTDFADYTDFLMEDTSGLMIKVEYKMVVFVQPAKWDLAVAPLPTWEREKDLIADELGGGKRL